MTFMCHLNDCHYDVYANKKEALKRTPKPITMKNLFYEMSLCYT